ncbi:MAG: hypothetical protein U1F06_05295 [Steroidobacteraceae bacterium]
MDAAALKRQAVRALTVLAIAVGLAVLLLLERSVENSADFDRWQPWILGASVLGVLVLGVLLGRKLWQLVRDFREHVPGSRLTLRTVRLFGALVILPLLVVYLFSLDFLDRGIDSWFRIEIKQGLNDALVLSRSALDLRLREQARRTEDFARSLRNVGAAELAWRLETAMRAAGASAIVVYTYGPVAGRWRSAPAASAPRCRARRPPRCRCRSAPAAATTAWCRWPTAITPSPPPRRSTRRAPAPSGAS